MGREALLGRAFPSLVVAAFASALLASTALLAADGDSSPGQPVRLADAKSRKPPIYVPPKPERGAAPRVREGAATRGFPTGRKPPAVVALSPDHVGLTVSAQPTLYWFVENDSDKGVALTLVEEGAAEPLLETQVDGPVQGGIHPLSLADHSVRLVEGRRYEWRAAPAGVTDAAAGSRGLIELRPMPASLRAELAADPARAVDVYARHGFWYDAFAAASAHAATDPDARKDRAALLAQVRLDAIADAEWEAAEASGGAASE